MTDFGSLLTLIEIHQIWNLLFQPAQSSDCLQLARYINESCDGAIEYLFDKQGQNDAVMELMAQQLRRETYYSYANSLVAAQGSTIIGMALSFPVDGLIIGEQLRQYYSQQRLRYIEYFVDNKLNNSWHLDALCVSEHARSQGVGSALLDQVKREAGKYDFQTVRGVCICNQYKSGEIL